MTRMGISLAVAALLGARWIGILAGIVRAGCTLTTLRLCFVLLG
jgi:hypothetical protein